MSKVFFLTALLVMTMTDSVWGEKSLQGPLLGPIAGPIASDLSVNLIKNDNPYIRCGSGYGILMQNASFNTWDLEQVFHWTGHMSYPACVKNTDYTDFVMDPSYLTVVDGVAKAVFRGATASGKPVDIVFTLQIPSDYLCTPQGIRFDGTSNRQYLLFCMKKQESFSF